MFAPEGMHYILLVNSILYAEHKNLDYLLGMAFAIGLKNKCTIAIQCVED